MTDFLGVMAEMASNKSDRSGSPSTHDEDGRRELIARQHRALYGNDGALLSPPAGFGSEESREQGKQAGPRGPSPRAMDPFGGSGQNATSDNAPQDHQRAENLSLPAAQTAFGAFEPTGPSGTASGDEGLHSRQLSKSTTAPLAGGMAPIGSRPNPQGQPAAKRTTSPLPSGLGYGFGAGEQANERSTSSNSNNNAPKEGSNNASMGAWGTGSGVWGSNKIGATSVWG